MAGAYCVTVGEDLDPGPHISDTHVKGRGMSADNHVYFLPVYPGTLVLGLSQS